MPPKHKREYSKIVVGAIVVFVLLYMVQNAVVMWRCGEYDSAVAVSLTVCLSICVATYNWRAQAADTYRYQSQRLEHYVKLKSEHPEMDFSDFPTLQLPENINHS